MSYSEPQVCEKVVCWILQDSEGAGCCPMASDSLKLHNGVPRFRKEPLAGHHLFARTPLQADYLRERRGSGFCAPTFPERSQTTASA